MYDEPILAGVPAVVDSRLGTEMLRELVTHLRQNRTQVRGEWVRRFWRKASKAESTSRSMSKVPSVNGFHRQSRTSRTGPFKRH